MTTTISVVMPAYNAGRWIEETLESVFGQTRQPHEVIVVDDGSTDDTLELLRPFGDAITVLSQPGNGGPPAAYNRGFDAATGDYVAMCPADDVWEPRKLEWQLEAVDTKSHIDIAFGGARYFGRTQHVYPRPRRDGLQDGSDFLREMYVRDLVAAPTTLVRRTLHQGLGCFDETLPSEDYEFWLRALVAGARFYFDPRLLVHLRQHGANVSSRAAEIWEMNHEVRVRFAPAVGDERLTRRLRARDQRMIARARFGLGQPERARDAYGVSLALRPSVEAAVGRAILAVPPLVRTALWINSHRPRHTNR